MECRKSAGDIPALNAVSLTEKIVLLHLISQLPGGLSDVGTKSSPGEASKKDEKGRILSLRQENEIVSTLAFLSGISNNPNEISAVCLEELPAEGACKILVAVNKLRPGSGQAVLDKIQRGFERIFRRLSTISSGMSYQPLNRDYQSIHAAGIIRKLLCPGDLATSAYMAWGL